jgi:hypothetical protein
MTNITSNEATDSSALQDVGAALKREGRQVASEAKAAAQKMAAGQRDALADYVAALAEAAALGAETLEEAGYGRSASTVARTADEVGGFAKRLQDREPGELWNDIEDFAREHPALVFGASFAAAFGITRFIKSSATSTGDFEPDRQAPAPAPAPTVAPTPGV